MKFDQLIYYPKKGHLHIGFKKNMKKERRQVFWKQKRSKNEHKRYFRKK